MCRKQVQRKREAAKRRTGRNAKQIEQDRESAKKIREKTRKRTKSLFHKGDELWKLCSVSVAIITWDPVRGSFATYRSSDDPDWPPPIKDIICAFPESVHQLSDNLPIEGKNAITHVDSDDESDLGSVFDLNKGGIQQGGVQEPSRICEVEGTAPAFTPLDMQGQTEQDIGVGVEELDSGQGSSTISALDEDFGMLDVAPSVSVEEGFSRPFITTRPSAQENVIPSTWLSGIRTTILGIIYDIPGS